jgi:transposase
MERKKRRTFTREYKAEVVRLVRTSGKNIAQVARELALGETAVRSWVQRADIDEKRDPNGRLTTDERSEVVRLRRELKTVTMERDFLRKAAVSSTGQGNISLKTSAGDRNPSVFLGRSFRRRATAFSRGCEKQPRGVFLGKYCLRSRLVFSLVPRCQGL